MAATDTESIAKETSAEKDCLYSLMLVSNLATTEEIKKSYRKLALQYHPDKLGSAATDAEQQEAKEKFQKLSTAYAILSDPSRRARYDATGSLDDSILNLKDDNVSWDTFFREIWSGVVNEQSIQDYKIKYKFSEEERRDVLDSYVKTKGVLLSIIDCVPLSTLDDISRFQAIIEASIAAGEVEHFKKFPHVNSREIARRRKLEAKEAKEVEQLLEDNVTKKKHGAKNDNKKPKPKNAKNYIDGDTDNADIIGDENTLATMIQAKNTSRMESLISRLEEKYQPKSVKRKRVAKTADSKSSSAESNSKVKPTDIGKLQNTEPSATLNDLKNMKSASQETTSSPSNTLSESRHPVSDEAVDDDSEGKTETSSNSTFTETRKARGNAISAPSRSSKSTTTTRRSKTRIK
ncbi:hypothetical protein QVD99_003400 [Batrachochytrium dendrobatidis]|nr:hypothetical protein O5D80_005056 [Batrachochytrium dendrobatidis]KAK5670077.1 hypothetical protein QVD99_003400 [Batrachochytrium dendrobatidis]